MPKKKYFPFPLEISFYYCLASEYTFQKYVFVISLVEILYNHTEQDFLRPVGHAVGCGFPVKEVVFHVFQSLKRSVVIAAFKVF